MLQAKKVNVKQTANKNTFDSKLHIIHLHPSFKSSKVP